MKEKKVETLLEILIDKIRELELECNLMKYERDELRKENAKLKNDIKFYEDELTPKEDIGNA